MRQARDGERRERGKSLAEAIETGRGKVGVFAADLLAWFPPPALPSAPPDEEPADAAIRINEFRENTRRATAAAFLVAEVVTLIRNALTKRGTRKTRTGADRAKGLE